MELAKYLVENVEDSHDVIRHIINSLPIVELQQLKMDLEFYYFDDSGTGRLLDFIDKRLYPSQMDMMPKMPNASINQLLDDFNNDKSGRITTSRIELQKRFDYQSFDDQKRIVEAFMRRTTKHDVVWCAKYLLDDWFWRDAYFDPVEWYWERDTDNYRLLRVIEKRASEEYLNGKVQLFENQNEGAIENKAYTWFLVRLGKDKNYVIKKERLSPFRYVYICAKTGRCVSLDEADSALSQVVSDELSEGFFCNRFRRKLDGSIAFDVRGRIGHALWVVAKTGNTTALIRFNEWIKEMCCEIENMQIVDCENITRLVLDRIFLPNLQLNGLEYG